jgi:hypothetical protein
MAGARLWLDSPSIPPPDPAVPNQPPVVFAA